MRTQVTNTETMPAEIKKHFWQKNKLRNLVFLTTTILSIYNWVSSVNKESVTIIVNTPLEEKKKGFIGRIFRSRK